MTLPRLQAVLLVGPTASGKTPLGDMIERAGLDGTACHHFDFGAELRRAARGERGDLSAQECAFLRDVLQGGRLLEDSDFHLAEKIFASFLVSRAVGRGDRVILNGFPRHLGQARMAGNFLDVSAVVVLECSQPDVYGRIAGNTGKDRCGRCDDAHSLVRRKLATYQSRTAPLVEYYRISGAAMVYLRVTASSETQEMYSDFVTRMRVLCSDSR